MNVNVFREFDIVDIPIYTHNIKKKKIELGIIETPSISIFVAKFEQRLNRHAFLERNKDF